MTNHSNQSNSKLLLEILELLKGRNHNESLLKSKLKGSDDSVVFLFLGKWFALDEILSFVLNIEKISNLLNNKLINFSNQTHMKALSFVVLVSYLSIACARDQFQQPEKPSTTLSEHEKSQTGDPSLIR